MWFNIKKPDFIFSIKFISYILSRLYSILCKSLLHYSIINRVLKAGTFNLKTGYYSGNMSFKKKEKGQNQCWRSNPFFYRFQLWHRLIALSSRLPGVVFRFFNRLRLWIWLRLTLNWLTDPAPAPYNYLQAPALTAS